MHIDDCLPRSHMHLLPSIQAPGPVAGPAALAFSLVTSPMCAERGTAYVCVPCEYAG
jgi:hypothetical protein